MGYVRLARPADAEEIARIQLTTWRVAYRRLLPRHVLDQLDPAWLTGRWIESISTPPTPTHRVLVAIEQAGPGGQAESSQHAEPAEPGPDSAPGAAAYLVGFAASGPADDAAFAPDEPADSLGARTAAVTELLVEPRWGRRGHGSRLLAACVAGWRNDGFDMAVGWAYEQDPATRGFLAGAGWEPDGARRALDVDDLLVPQLRMHTRLIE